MERALVTGVTGFIGAHLARTLIAEGATVHAVVRPDARLDRIPDLVDTVVFHVDDGTTERLARAVRDAAPEASFHLATNFVAEHRADQVGALVADNVGFPARLADALADAGATSLVNVGTAWQHVDGAPYRPKNLYAATKQAFEVVLQYYTDRDLLRVVTVNVYDSYGPLDHRGKLLSHLVRSLRTGEALDMGSGVQLIDLVHVDDIAAALVGAADLLSDRSTADRSTTGGVAQYAVSSGQPRTLRELVATLSSVAGTDVPVRWGARTDRAGDMTRPWTAGPPPPGWTPSVSLEAGLAALLAEDANDR